MDSSICSSTFTQTTSTHVAEADVGVTAAGEECYNVEIGLILDDKPDEVAWEITSGRKSTLQQPDATVISTSPYYSDKYRQASDTYVICLPQGKVSVTIIFDFIYAMISSRLSNIHLFITSQYTFTMIDLGHDGICCTHSEGKYVLSYKPTGELISQGAQFGSSKSTVFKVPYVAPKLVDSNGDDVEDRTQNIIPTIPLTSHGDPSCSNKFGLHLVTDDYGVESTWELREKSDNFGDYTNGKIVASGGPYTSDFTYDITYCVDPGQYTFVFYDWQCDGLTGVKTDGYYTLEVNGVEVHTGGTNMKQYDEVVDLSFMNPLVGYEELEASGQNSLDMLKEKDSNGARENSMYSTFVILALLATAFSVN